MRDTNIITYVQIRTNYRTTHIMDKFASLPSPREVLTGFCTDFHVSCIDAIADFSVSLIADYTEV